MTERISRKFKFTKKLIQALPPNDRNNKSTDQEYSDSEVPGLKLFVSKNGRKSFHFRYCINKRKRVVKISDVDCLDLSEVRDIARQHRGSISKNIDPLAERGKITDIPDFKTFSLSYMEWCRAHKRSWKDDDNKLKADLLPTFGKKQLTAISRKDIQDYLLAIKKRTSGVTANRHFALISKMFSLANEWDVLAGYHPCQKLKKFAEGKGRIRRLTDSEMKSMLNALDKRKGDVGAIFIKFLLFCGLRCGESMALEWTDVAKDFSQINIRMELAKSKKSRDIILNNLAIEVIHELDEIRKKVNSRYLFPGLKPGTHMKNPRRLFTNIKKEASIQDFKLHDCRHSYASKCLESGASLYEVMELLGHADHRTTQIYCHNSPGQIKKATDNFARDVTRIMSGV